MPLLFCCHPAAKRRDLLFAPARPLLKGPYRLFIALCLSIFAALPAAAQLPRQSPGELAWAIRNTPTTFDPARVDDAGSELVRFLTAGTLIRTNRRTGQPEPALSDHWQVSPDGRTLTFHLRAGLRFSDGAPLTSADAAFSLHRVLDPATAAPAAEEFLAPTQVRIETPDPATLRILLPLRIVNAVNLLDEIAIEPLNRPSSARITAGPFTLGETQPGQYIRLLRNPYYFKRDNAGAQLPYAPSLRLDVLANRETEIARFLHGDYDLIDTLSPDYFALLAARAPASVHDAGPSLNTEQLWFNQAPSAPIPAYERAWFTSQPFRTAVSQAIHRADLARIAYGNHATPAHNFISPINTSWYDTNLKYPTDDPAAAQRLLAQAGFRKQGATLVDPAGHPVKFSLLTNAGNATRARMASLIQADLASLGIELSIVTLDFPALIDRLLHSQNYEACLLGHPNVDLDPNATVNEWLSSSPNHQWNPSEKTPATPWEAEIDAAMHTQATSSDPRIRRAAVDRVQQIVADQQPYLYLVHPNMLFAISPQLKGTQPAILAPALVWNIEYLHREPATR